MPGNSVDVGAVAGRRGPDAADRAPAGRPASPGRAPAASRAAAAPAGAAAAGTGRRRTRRRTGRRGAGPRPRPARGRGSPAAAAASRRPRSAARRAGGAGRWPPARRPRGAPGPARRGRRARAAYRASACWTTRPPIEWPTSTGGRGRAARRRDDVVHVLRAAARCAAGPAAAVAAQRDGVRRVPGRPRPRPASSPSTRRRARAVHEEQRAAGPSSAAGLPFEHLERRFATCCRSHRRTLAGGTAVTRHDPPGSPGTSERQPPRAGDEARPATNGAHCCVSEFRARPRPARRGWPRRRPR